MSLCTHADQLFGQVFAMDELPPEFDHVYSAETFLGLRPHLPEAGQWAELESGRVQLLPAPDVEHGDIVGNLSKAIAAHVSSAVASTPPEGRGISLFRQPLRIPHAAERDTVRIPMMSWVSGIAGFAAMDSDLLMEPPSWVVELAGNRIVRQRMTSRVQDLLNWGVTLVWVVDPDQRSVFTMTKAGATKFTGEDRLTASPVLNAFSVKLDSLFDVPPLWTDDTRNGSARSDAIEDSNPAAD